MNDVWATSPPLQLSSWLFEAEVLHGIVPVNAHTCAARNFIHLSPPKHHLRWRYWTLLSPYHLFAPGTSGLFRALVRMYIYNFHGSFQRSRWWSRIWWRGAVWCKREHTVTCCNKGWTLLSTKLRIAQHTSRFLWRTQSLLRQRLILYCVRDNFFSCSYLH